MPTKRIVLLSNRSVLVAGIRLLLESIEGLELAVVPGDDPEVRRRIHQLAPQAILLDCERGLPDHGLVTQMLEEHPKARVIVLGVNRQDIEVYSLRKVRHTDLDGLLEAIGGRTAAGRGSKGHGA
jgi:DNA-binding NarL/FixJ family response regulator